MRTKPPVRSQRGQAMTEYIVLVVAVFIGLIPVMQALQEAFERYYAFVATWISLPIP
jgi:Flp pilus assembly pilin Flp